MAQPKVTSTGEVLAAAAKVFTLKGYKRATLDDIALEAGVSKPTLYKYSQGKQSMLDNISKETRETLSARINQNQGLAGIERLKNSMLVATQSTADLHYFYKATLNNSLELSPTAAQESREWMRRVTHSTEEVLRQCHEEGSLHLPGNVRIYANLLQSMYRGIFYWYDPSGTTTPEELAQHMLCLLEARTYRCSGRSHR